MNVISMRKILALTAMVVTITAVPNTASARGSVHVDIPGISIGFHDRHFGHHRKYRKRHKRHHRRHYRNHHHYDYYPRRVYRSYDYYGGYRDRGYRDRGYRDRGYRDRGYRDNNEYCPTPGYSRRYHRNRGCYSHGDHYHCDG